MRACSPRLYRTYRKDLASIIVFLNKRHEKIMAFSKSGSEIMSKLMNCEKKALAVIVSAIS